MVVAGAFRARSELLITARLDPLGLDFGSDDVTEDTDAERAEDDLRSKLDIHDPVLPSILRLRVLLLHVLESFSCVSFIAGSVLFAVGFWS